MKRLPRLTLLALLVVGAAHAAGVSPGAASPVQREQAQALFVQGKKLFDQHKFAESLTSFRSAMDIVATPNARLYVARCLRETGQLVEAYVEFDRTAVEANEHAREDSRYAKTGASARVERDALAPQIGFVRVEVQHATESTRLRVGTEEIRQAGWAEPIPVMPGDTEVTVESPPNAPVHQTVSVKAGEKKAVSLDAAAEPAPVAVTAVSSDRRALRPYAYVAGGIGVAGLLTFTIAGILSDSTFSDLSSACGNRPCPSSKQSEVSRGQAEQTAADIGLGFGIAGLGVGTALFLLSLPRKETGAEPPPAATGPTVSAGPGWVGVRGSF